MSKYVIAMDAMGGDNAPHAVVDGAIQALRQWNDIKILLAGPEEKLNELIAEAADVKDRIEIIPADEVISMDETPVLQVRKKKNSSMVQAMLAVKEGRAQAFISAGSTGAVLAGSILRIGRIRGISRPALGPVMPARKKPFILVDCGANVDCTPEYLLQFGMMGSVYMKSVMGVADPKVGLVNIGAEEEKGNELTKKTYQLMKQQKLYTFAGNCEAREIPTGDFDVVVADGFDGNIILKFMEGLASTMFSMMKEKMMGNLRSKIGALLVKPALREFKKSMDYEEYGGAPLLGVDGAVIKAHGSSNGKAMCSAIRQARTMIETDVVGVIREGVKQMTAQRENEAAE